MRFELDNEDLRVLASVQKQLSMDVDGEYVSGRLFTRYTKTLRKLKEQIPAEEVQARRIRIK